MKAVMDKTRTEDSVMDEVRRLKEENAAEYGFNVEAIGRAARRRQQEHPDRIVNLRKSRDPLKKADK